jgi:hypothetical protein
MMWYTYIWRRHMQMHQISASNWIDLQLNWAWPDLIGDIAIATARHHSNPTFAPSSSGLEMVAKVRYSNSWDEDDGLQVYNTFTTLIPLLDGCGSVEVPALIFDASSSIQLNCPLHLLASHTSQATSEHTSDLTTHLLPP